MCTFTCIAIRGKKPTHTDIYKEEISFSVTVTGDALSFVVVVVVFFFLKSYSYFVFAFVSNQDMSSLFFLVFVSSDTVESAIIDLTKLLYYSMLSSGLVKSILFSSVRLFFFFFFSFDSLHPVCLFFLCLSLSLI